MNLGSILATMRPIAGWFTDDEARLLIATATAALMTPGPVVEVGSYCGRSTVVLGSVVRDLCPAERVYAIDPHGGKIHPEQVEQPSTLERFRRNIAAAGVAGVVETIVARSTDVAWDGPIRLLFIDGWHTYEHVSRDFNHFARWVAPDGLVAFHDYATANNCPDVIRFVNDTLAVGAWVKHAQADSLIVLRRFDA